MSVQVKLEGFDEATKLLGNVAKKLGEKILDRSLAAAAKPVVAAAKATAPRSKLTGTGLRQSKKQQAESPKPLADTIGFRVVNYPATGVVVAVVGPQHPAGAHGHLVEKGHKAFYWGRSSGYTREADLYSLGKARKNKTGTGRSKRHKRYSGAGARVEGKEFLAPAADSTRAIQQSELIRVLSTEIAKVS